MVCRDEKGDIQIGDGYDPIDAMIHTLPLFIHSFIHSSKMTAIEYHKLAGDEVGSTYDTNTKCGLLGRRCHWCHHIERGAHPPIYGRFSMDQRRY